MKIALTPEQRVAIEPSLIPGAALLGRVLHEPFDGTNGQTCGRLVIELGSVPERCLPSLRDAIRKANRPKPTRAKKTDD